MRTWAALAAVNAFLAVAVGAFGAHALKQRLSTDMLAVFETGARYHFFHALGLFVVAWLASQGLNTRPAGIALQLGIVLFSGSLYALSLSGVRALGMVTPLGGLAFLAGWALIAWECVKRS
jgi:uncharacterized membrane protein YgdD (TMEM256/DUF423 family)